MPQGCYLKARYKISVIRHSFNLSMHVRQIQTTHVQNSTAVIQSSRIPLKIALTYKHSSSCKGDHFLLFLIHTMYSRLHAVS